MSVKVVCAYAVIENHEVKDGNGKVVRRTFMARPEGEYSLNSWEVLNNAEGMLASGLRVMILFEPCGPTCRVLTPADVLKFETMFIVDYHHRNGNDVMLVSADVDPTPEEVIEKLGLDFEPEDEEYIDITPVRLVDLRTATAPEKY